MKHINLSFAACGFLGIYHLGAASALCKHGRKLLKDVKAFAGASAGSLVSTVLLTAPQKLEECKAFTYTFAEEICGQSFGAMIPSYDFMARLRCGMESILPAKAHQLAHRRLHVFITNTRTRQNYLVSSFSSREDLIKVLLASSFVPIYTGLTLVKYKGQAGTLRSEVSWADCCRPVQACLEELSPAMSSRRLLSRGTAGTTELLCSLPGHSPYLGQCHVCLLPGQDIVGYSVLLAIVQAKMCLFKDASLDSSKGLFLRPERKRIEAATLAHNGNSADTVLSEPEKANLKKHLGFQDASPGKDLFVEGFRRRGRVSLSAGIIS
ncbi:patatin-like phospholipase domain-containing protein 5 [Sorex fumeus]|uniref:patatin-like phospholipase domain-containing protein 5 n=1 Tax=Sorex fumeus TaxID=62283 RepID=UPI0024AD264A|nr:patatin-like phospholipase domain-containing protein 5 [Sorex fumeus]